MILTCFLYVQIRRKEKLNVKGVKRGGLTMRRHKTTGSSRIRSRVLLTSPPAQPRRRTLGFWSRRRRALSNARQQHGHSRSQSQAVLRRGRRVKNGKDRRAGVKLHSHGAWPYVALRNVMSQMMAATANAAEATKKISRRGMSPADAKIWPAFKNENQI